MSSAGCSTGDPRCASRARRGAGVVRDLDVLHQRVDLGWPHPRSCAAADGSRPMRGVDLRRRSTGPRAGGRRRRYEPNPAMPTMSACSPGELEQPAGCCRRRATGLAVHAAGASRAPRRLQHDLCRRGSDRLSGEQTARSPRADSMSRVIACIRWSGTRASGHRPLGGRVAGADAEQGASAGHDIERRDVGRESGADRARRRSRRRCRA